CDDGIPQECDLATVYLLVYPIEDNDPPVTVNEHINLCQDETYSGNILSNGDYDPEGLIIYCSTPQVSGPMHGTLTIGNDCSFTYTPNPGYYGSDQFIISVCDIYPLTPACANDTVFFNVIQTQIAQAGPDQQWCHESNTFLIGNSPSGTTGNWIQVSGPNVVTLFPSNSPNASIGGMIPGVYQFVYTLYTTVNCFTTDTITVTNYPLPSTAYAGPDQVLCLGGGTTTSTTVSGNIPAYGYGVWEQVLGPTIASIADSLSPVTGISNLAAGEYGFNWVIYSGPCESINDYIHIIVNQPPAADAGPDAQTCQGVAYPLNGATASHYQAISWTSTGTGVFSNPIDLNPTYTPSLDDVTAGSVTLTITAQGIAPCPDQTSTMTLTVIPNPVFICPLDFTQAVDSGLCTATIIDTLSDILINNGCVASITNSFTMTNDASGIYPVGTTIVTWTVVYLDGSVVTCEQKITVTEYGSPIITCPADISQAADPGQCHANVQITNPTATDNCSTIITFTGVRSDALALNAPYPLGVTTITWTAADASGNTSIPCIQTVTITDTVAPVITCPPDITQTAIPGYCYANVTITNPTATDNCSTTFTFTGIRSDALALHAPYPVGVTTITWTAADGSGNTSIPCAQTVTVIDNQIPVITCPADITQTVVPGYCFANVTITDPTATDNCSTTFTFTGVRSDALPLNAPYPIGVTTITWTAGDASGNTSMPCIQTVTVTENVPPVITCPANIMQTAFPGYCYAYVTITNPTATDNCSTTFTFNGVRSDALALNAPYPVGVTTITWTATDASGNTSIPCIQTVTVTENVPPVIICPSNITQNADPGQCSANVTIIDPTAFDLCSTTFTFSGIRSDALPLNAPYPVGITTIIWTATDASGNISIPCAQTVIIIDNQIPVITCPADITQAAIPGYCYANVQIINPTATDNCSTTFTFTGVRSDALALNAPYPVGVTTITWTATDGAGNTSISCIQTITITDNVPPVITCPSDITQAAIPGYCYANVTITNPTATDNCSTTFTFTGVRSDALALNAPYPLGVTTITWTAADGSGNTSIPCIQTVTITDNVSPVIVCPANITQAAIPGYCFANVTITNPTATDNCSTTLTFAGIRSDALPLNAPYPVGVTTITWTAADGSGNTSIACLQTVTVTENMPPVITCPANITQPVIPGQCFAYVTITNPTATDNCSTTFTFTGVRSDALALNAPYPVGVTTITWTATDASGNTSIPCIQTVTITENVPPVIICPANITQNAAPGQCSANVNIINPTATDNCSVTFTFTGIRSDALALNAPYPVGITTIIWRATDASGSTSIPCTQTVTVIDNQIPVITCPANITQAAIPGQCYANVQIPNPTATDNCSTTFTFTGIRSDGAALNTPYPLGITTIVWTAADASGNISIPCLQTVTVYDNQVPVITCPPNITQTAVPGQCYANVQIIYPTATDNCSTTFSFTGIRSDGLALNALYPVGITTITWTATDGAGNTSTSCIQTVTITDIVPPVIICPANITQTAIPGYCFANVTIINPTATDNCSTTFTFTGIRSDALALNAPYPIGVTTITWRAADGSGNTSIPCIQTVTVTENVPPVITCPANITQAATPGQCFAYVTIINPTATDNCSTTLTFTGIRSDGLALSEHYPVGITTITWTATDASGNTSIPCIQTITVTENVPPLIVCPPDITQTTDPGQCNAEVPIVDPTGIDVCSPNLTFTGIRSDNLALGAPYPVGITTITWTATDGSGNTSIPCIQYITIISPPVANTDHATTPEDLPVVINVLANDTDCDNNIDPGTVNTFCPACFTPSNGTITINPGTGEITYTPDPNYNGTDTLVYEVCDSGIPSYCDTALVIITVTPVNDPPVVNDSTVTIPQDSIITVCLPITDIDGPTPFSLASIGCFNNGTATAVVIGNEVCITYTPNPGWNGTDTVCITICDAAGACDNALLIINVLPEAAHSVIGLAKKVTEIIKQKDGTFNVTFFMTVANIGNDVLHDVQVTDDLSLTFPAPATFSISSGPVATGNLLASTNYDGVSNINLLKISSFLAVGEISHIEFTVNVRTNSLWQEHYLNTAIGNGIGTLGLSVTDSSDNGTDIDPNENGITNEIGENDPTPFTLKPTGLYIPDGFSPNDDGINDFFVIKGIENYPDNEFKVFNRWGNLIYQKKQYDNTWDGVPNSGMLRAGKGKVQAGTYYYVLEFNTADLAPAKGYIIVQY
ncbi:MAG TPA: HYR domain-containing protein, partial [Bacteroidales bacterium]|nr:HYR domain-containing protein [Bacteroidales bacterium]